MVATNVKESTENPASVLRNTASLHVPLMAAVGACFGEAKPNLCSSRGPILIASQADSLLDATSKQSWKNT